MYEKPIGQPREVLRITKAMSSPSRSRFRILWKVHKFLWRISGGRIGNSVGNFDVLELMTTGRKTGEQRSVLLYCLPGDSGPLVAGSNLGASRDPAWVENLRVDPAARIVHGRETSEVVARFLAAEERKTQFEEFKKRSRDYTRYEQLTDREIPVIALESPT